MAFSVQIREPEARGADEPRPDWRAAARHDWLWIALPVVLLAWAWLRVSVTISPGVSLVIVSAALIGALSLVLGGPATRAALPAMEPRRGIMAHARIGEPPRTNLIQTAAAIVSLTKPGLVVLVLATTFAGFYLGAAGEPKWPALAGVLAGTAMVAAGALSYNEYAERDLDGLMLRTARRPLPSARLDAPLALRVGAGLGVAGLLALMAAAPNAALLAAMALLVYTAIYTPLKRVSPLATLAGSFAGAIPPLIGWSAATESLSAGAWVLFLILFFWQVPHFLAIGWRWRADYRRAGIPIYCVLDASGRATGIQTIIYTVCLIPVSAAPAWIGMAGTLYLTGAMTLGVLLLGFAAAFALKPTQASARRLFLATIVYLPLLMGMMMM